MGVKKIPSLYTRILASRKERVINDIRQVQEETNKRNILRSTETVRRICDTVVRSLERYIYESLGIISKGLPTVEEWDDISKQTHGFIRDCVDLALREIDDLFGSDRSAVDDQLSQYKERLQVDESMLHTLVDITIVGHQRATEEQQKAERRQVCLATYSTLIGGVLGIIGAVIGAVME